MSEQQQSAAQVATDNASALNAAIAEAVASVTQTETDIAGALANEAEHVAPPAQGEGTPAPAGGVASEQVGAGSPDAGTAEAEGAGPDDAAGADPAGDGAEASEGGDVEDEGANQERSVLSKYAEIKRKEKRIGLREEALDTREQGLLQRERQLLQQVDRWSSEFDRFEKDPLAFLGGYAQARGTTIEALLTHVNKQHIGVQKESSIQRQQPAADTSKIQEQIQRLQISNTVNRALASAADKYPLMRSADPVEMETQAVDAIMSFISQHGRNPSADEVFKPIERRLRFEKWEAEQANPSAQGSAPKANPATPQGVTGKGNGETPSGKQPSAGHGSGAQAQSQASPKTITNAGAAARSGIHRYMDDEEAKAAAIAEALNFARG